MSILIKNFCEEVAVLDQRCFEEGTNPQRRRFKNILDAWDENGHKNGILETVEFNKATVRMDLDGDKINTALEISAYFIRNSYLVCRPVRLPVIEKLSRKRE